MGLKYRYIFGFAAVITLLAFLILPPRREKAILFARSGDMSKAEGLLDDILKNHPDDTVAILELAEGFMRVGDADKAESLLALFRKHHHDLRPYARRLARIYAAGYEYEKAVALLELDAKANREELIRLCTAAGMNDRAVRYLRLRLTGGAKDLAVWQEIETLQQWQINIDGVGEALENIARLKPTTEHISDVLDFFFWRNNPGKIREYASLLAAQRKLSSDDLRLLRSVWLKLLDLPAARDAATELVARDDASAEDFTDLVTIHTWNNDRPAADRALAAGLAKFPTATALLWQGVTLSLNRDDPAAAASYQQRLGEVSNDPQMLRAAAENYVRGGKEETAIDLLRQLSSTASANPEDLLRLARLYNAQKKTDLAIAASLRLYRMLNADGATTEGQPGAKPGSIQAKDETLAETALLLEELGRKDESRNLLQQMARRGNLEAQYLLAQLYLNERRFSDALLILNELTARAPGDLRRRAAFLTANLKIDAYYLAEDRERDATAAAARASRLGSRDTPAVAPSGSARTGPRGGRTAALRSTGPEPTPTRTAVAPAPAAARPPLADQRTPQQRKAQMLDVIATLRTAFRLADEFPPSPERAAETRTENDRLRQNLVDFLLLADLTAEASAELAKLDNPPAALMIEVAARLAENGDKAGARGWAQRIKDTDSLEAQQIARLGGVWLDVGEYRRALDLLQTADEKTKHIDKPIRLQLARALGENGDKAGQYAILDDYAHRPEAAAEDWLAAADARGMWDEPEAELAILREAGRLFPTGAVIAARTASLLAGMGYESEAKAEAWRLNGLKLKKDVPTLLLAAYALLDVRQQREAGRLITLAEAIPGDFPEVLLARARWLAAKRDLRKALLMYRTYLEKRADDPAAWYELAQIRHETGNYGAREAAARGREFLLAAERGAPGWSAADYALASGLSDFLGQRDSALINAGKASAKLPNVPAHGLRLAGLYNAYGKYARAAQIGARELQYHPELSEPQRVIATAKAGERKPAEAEAVLTAYLQQKPDDSAALTDLAAAQADQGKWRTAVGTFRKAEIAEAQDTFRSARREHALATTEATAEILIEETPEPDPAPVPATPAASSPPAAPATPAVSSHALPAVPPAVSVPTVPRTPTSPASALQPARPAEVLHE